MLLAQFILSCSIVSSAPSSVAAPAVHCQVPCGIYGDHLRMERLLEDTKTIEKAMAEINALGKEKQPNWNQLVRWINTKEEHAQAIQDQVGDYWLAQRIKLPAVDASKEENQEAQRLYAGQLAVAHQIIVSAMKCKQTTDPQHVSPLAGALKAFEMLYFTDEDHEHLRGHSADNAQRSHISDASDALASKLAEAKTKAAQAGVLLLNDAVAYFRLNNGMYPSSLSLLAEKDSQGASYVPDADQLIDPWGNAYALVPDGNGEMDIVSYGSDGKPGGDGGATDISVSGLINGTIKRIR